MKSKIGIPMEGFAEFSKKVASEGVVLLKNENEVLPFQKNETISIFGRCQIEYYRSGTGSGGAVNVAYNTNILDSFDKNQVNETLADLYRAFIKENPFDTGGGGWACEPWSQKEMALTPEIVAEAKQKSDKALIVIGRTAGEDKDNLDVEGSYLLTELEEIMVKEVTAVFDRVCIVLNISNVIDMSWSEKYNIDGIVCSWNGGMEGGGATVDVLMGKVCPSGKLPDTFAKTIESHSSTKNHGGKERNIYQEDIYVGYRYFSTFAPESVLYPFGFGLSYTTFAVSDIILEEMGDYHYTIKATVKNTGATHTGKEVVQVYLNPPQGTLGKAVRNLVGFAKTKALAPNETETVEIEIPCSRLVSYDDSGATGHKSAYVLEAGTYELYVGTDVNAIEKQSFSIPSLVVVEQLQEALAPREKFGRMKPKKVGEKFEISYEVVPTLTVDMKRRVDENIPEEIPYTGSKNIQITDVKSGKATMDDFIAQLSEADLCALVLGEGMSHPHVTEGTASAFCGVTESLRAYGLPLICCADGPSGIRMEGGLQSTQVPIGTLLAATWDVDLIEELYTFTGKEMVRNYVDILLGPGMNIHRNPLNGRNFEYFSEDPLLTGLMASAVTKGIAKSGVSATLKHFACNSQETHRHSIDAVVSERAVREIYLKAFEIAVKEGGADAIMTAYNPLNGVWTASNYDLNTTILREEWGYNGFVMTDWWASMNDPVTGGAGSKLNKAAMVKAQNDVYMVINNFDAENFGTVTDLKESLEKGTLSISQLQRCAKNICQFAMESSAMNRPFSLMAEPKKIAGKPASATDYTCAEEETIIKIKDNKGFSFTCTEEGAYEFSVQFKLQTTDLAQIFFMLKLNDETAAVMLTGDTNGQVVRKKLREIHLEKGVYTAELEVGNDTFFVESVEIKKR
ncbi:MAG: glycoside hydrolase family 3 N-terminal domain-containing protein [Bacillota bacterium]